MKNRLWKKALAVMLVLVMTLQFTELAYPYGRVYASTPASEDGSQAEETARQDDPKPQTEQAEETEGAIHDSYGKKFDHHDYTSIQRALNEAGDKKDVLLFHESLIAMQQFLAEAADKLLRGLSGKVAEDLAEDKVYTAEEISTLTAGLPENLDIIGTHLKGLTEYLSRDIWKETADHGEDLGKKPEWTEKIDSLYREVCEVLDDKEEEPWHEQPPEVDLYPDRSDSSFWTELSGEEMELAGDSSEEQAPTEEELSGTDEQITAKEEIAATAEGLTDGHSCFDYVWSHVDRMEYFGGRFGDFGALDTGAGNDIDQASLLISLLRKRGIAARYVFGTVRASKDRVLCAVRAKDTKQALALLKNRGRSVSYDAETESFTFEETWVEAYENGEWIAMDPAFKVYERSMKEAKYLANIRSIVRDLFSAEGEGVPDLTEETARLESYLAATPDVFDAERKIKAPDPAAYGQLPYEVVSVSEKAALLPAELADTIKVNLGDASVERTAAALYGKTIAFRFEMDGTLSTACDYFFDTYYNAVAWGGTIPSILIDGEKVAGAKGKSLGGSITWGTEIKSGRYSSKVENSTSSSGYQVLHINYGKYSERLLQKADDDLEALSRDVAANGQGMLSRLPSQQYNYFAGAAVQEPVLNQSGTYYFASCNENNKELETMTGVRIQTDYGVGLTAYYTTVSGGVIKGDNYSIDVPNGGDSLFAAEGDEKLSKTILLEMCIKGSELEGEIWENLLGDKPISTTDLLKDAAEEGRQILFLSSANYDQFKSQLSQTAKDAAKDLPDNTFIITHTGSMKVGDWSGTGYYRINLDSGSFASVISGGKNGGENSALVTFAALVAALSMAHGLCVAVAAMLAATAMLPALAYMALAAAAMYGLVNLYDRYTQYMGMKDLAQTDPELYAQWKALGDGIISEALFAVLAELGALAVKGLAGFVGKTQAMKALQGYGFTKEGAELFLKENGIKGLRNCLKLSNLIKQNVAPDLIARAVKAMGEGGLKLPLLFLRKVANSLEDVDDIFKAVQRYGDDFVRVFTEYGDDVYRAVANYGDDAAQAVFNYGDDALRVIDKYGDDAVRVINEYGADGVRILNQYGDDAVRVAKQYGDDAVRVLNQYGDDAIRVIDSYGDDAIRAMNEGIQPELMENLDKLGIKPSSYQDLGITSEAMAKRAEQAITDYGDDALQAITKHKGNALACLDADPARQKDILTLINRADTICVQDPATGRYVNYLDLINDPNEAVRVTKEFVAQRDLALANVDLELPNMTVNPNSSKAVLGKTNYGGVSYKTVAIDENATYFNPDSDDFPWSYYENQYGQLGVWELNEEYLRRQISAGKEILLSHNPYDPKIRVGFYKMECDFLEANGFTFEKNVGEDCWRAVST